MRRRPGPLGPRQEVHESQRGTVEIPDRHGLDQKQEHQRAQQPGLDSGGFEQRKTRVDAEQHRAGRIAGAIA